MTKRQYEQYSQYRELKDQGFQIHDDLGVRKNSGSESLAHWNAKCNAAKVLIDAGFRVDSETPRVHNQEVIGEVDLLAFGLEDRRPIVVETEQNVDRDIVLGKLDRYSAEAIREVFVLDVDELSTDYGEMYSQISEELGL